MKSLLLTLATVLSLALNSQTEVKELKRNISLGEREGFKITLPNQKIDRFSKPHTTMLKKLNGKSVKASKGSNEIIYNNISIQGTEQPVAVYIIMDQEVSQIGYTAFFIDEKTNEAIKNNSGTDKFMQKIYNLSMHTLYQDSIDVQSDILKEAEGTLKDKSKDADKNQKNINKAKNKIRDAEAEIEKSKASVEAAKGQLGSLAAAIDANKSRVKDAEAEMKKADQAGDELKEMLNKNKKLQKNLGELQKDPTTNANLIIAQEADIAKLSEEVKVKTEAVKGQTSSAKSMLKNAEKDLDKSQDNLKDAEKKIKQESSSIEKNTEAIADCRKTIAENEKQIEGFESAEKGKSEEAINAVKKRLDELKLLQAKFQ